MRHQHRMILRRLRQYGRHRGWSREVQHAGREAKPRRLLGDIGQVARMGGIAGIVQHGQAPAIRRQQFRQHFQPFAPEHLARGRRPGHIAARPRERGHKPKRHRVHHLEEDNRDAARGLLRRPCLGGTGHDDHIGLRRHNLGGKAG